MERTAVQELMERVEHLEIEMDRRDREVNAQIKELFKRLAEHQNNGKNGYQILHNPASPEPYPPRKLLKESST